MDYMIVGLGNPGAQYSYTRHNAGWLAIDYIAQQLNIKINKIKFKATYASVKIGTNSVLLLKPQTFMNLSGQSVVEAAAFYKIPPEKIIVLCDDVSLPCGKLRIRRSGSDGGHNGLKNIIYLMDSDQFPRIKIGISDRPDKRMDLADWVLGNFSKEELDLIQKDQEKIWDSVQLIINNRIEDAMAKYN